MTSPTKPSISHTDTLTNMPTNKVRNKHPLMQHKVRMNFSYNMNSHFYKFHMETITNTMQKIKSGQCSIPQCWWQNIPPPMGYGCWCLLTHELSKSQWKLMPCTWRSMSHSLLSRNSTMKTIPQSNNTCKRYGFLKKFPMNFKMKIEIN